MVAGFIIIGALVLLFLPQIASAVRNVTDTQTGESEAIKQQKEEREFAKQVQREDEGLFDTVGRFFLGDNAFDKEKENKLDPKPETKSPKRLAKITPNDKSPFDIKQGVITEKETGNIVGFAGLDSFASEITRRGKEVAA